MPPRPSLPDRRFTIELLDDEDALSEAVGTHLAAHDLDNETRQLALVALDVVRQRLDPHGEVLDHAMGLLDASFEEAACALVQRVLRDARDQRRRLDDEALGDPNDLGDALDAVVGCPPKIGRRS